MIDWREQATLWGFPSTDAGVRAMLSEWYEGLKMSSGQIAGRIGTTIPTVTKALRKYSIEVRKRGGENNVVWKAQRKSHASGQSSK